MFIKGSRTEITQPTLDSVRKAQIVLDGYPAELNNNNLGRKSRGLVESTIP